MDSSRRVSKFLCTLMLLSPAISSASADVESDAAVGDNRRIVAQWLSGQFNREVDASLILSSNLPANLEECRVTRVRTTNTGATALSVQCPNRVPQVVLLATSISAPSSTTKTRSNPRLERPIVRAGSSLRADWHTDNMHAELDVIAMDPGAAGAEIRVRIARTNRVLLARIVNSHSAIVVDPRA